MNVSWTDEEGMMMRGFKRVLLAGFLIVYLSSSVFAEEALPDKLPGEVVIKTEAISPKELNQKEVATVLPPIQSPESEPVVLYFDNTPRYNFDWQDTKLTDSLYAVAKAAGKNITINGKLDGTVFTYLTQKTFDEALNVLANTFNFNWMVEGDTILVSTSDTMLQSKRFELKHANLKFVKEELASLGIVDKGINGNSEYNSISVTGTPYAISMAEKRIAEMDKPVAQCLIVAQMIEVAHGDTLKLGPQYTLPTYAYDGSSSSTASSSSTPTSYWDWSKMTFAITSSADRSLSKGKVLARPMAVTQNGQEAVIDMGDKVPVLTSTTTTSSTEVTVTYQDVGNTLKVTPVINKENGTVGLNIDTKVSSIAKWITSGGVSAPQISSRSAKTTAHLRSGETLVIGGLMNSSEMDNLSGIPGLMNLPILGELFKYHSTSKDNSEVFILVTPYIIDDGMDLNKAKSLVMSKG